MALPESGNIRPPRASLRETRNLTHRVLIVSPHFPPVNAPDHQRIRMSLPHFAEFGWEATVLAVSPEYVEALQDCSLGQTVPESTRVIRTRALPVKQTRRLGVGNLGVRALPYLRKAGDKILREEHFDLVYFSTTVFSVMSLGPRWQRRWGVPYVLDFQDPWFSSYVHGPNASPPGGAFKYGLSQRLSKILEPRTLRKASHVISVSPAYPEMLKRRYRWLPNGVFSVLPFGASEQDFECVQSSKIEQHCFDPSDGKKHWVYVGRGGSDMELAVRSLFQALSQARQTETSRWNDVMLHFIGTDYAPPGQGRKSIEPIAMECGVGDLVQEITDRIPYLEALRCMLDAQALLVLGSDDPSYTPSKLYPCILAKKPLLVVAHSESSAVDIIRETGAGTLVSFATAESSSEIARRITSTWFSSVLAQPKTSWGAFLPYTAREMTRTQCAIFDQCLATSRTELTAA